MTALSTLARMLGLKPELAEDALHSERAARAVLTRRNLFAAGGALAAGSVFSFGVPKPTFWIQDNGGNIIADLQFAMREMRKPVRPQILVMSPDGARAWAYICPPFAAELRRAGINL